MPETTIPYKYRAFGLDIQSEIEIPEFLAGQFAVPEVEVVISSTPSALETPEKTGVCYQVKEQEFLLWVDNIARYYVKEGKKITIQKYGSSTLQEVRLFLIGVVFSALLQQRSKFALHASAIKHGEECFLICGRSGAGKSTLTREFLNAGYQLLADDISVISGNDQAVFVQPAFPFIKLWKDSMDHLELKEEEGRKLRDEMEKYGFQLTHEFYSEELPVSRIFILVPYNQPVYKSEQLTGLEKFAALKNHTYRFQFISTANRSYHFKALHTLASDIPVTRIYRPQAPIDAEDLRVYLEKVLDGNSL